MKPPNRRGSISPMMNDVSTTKLAVFTLLGLPLHSSQGDRSDDHALREQEEQDRRNRRDCRSCHLLAVGIQEVRPKLNQCHWERHHICAIDGDVWPGELVPVEEKSEDSEGSHGPARCREHDVQQDTQMVCAIELGRV